MITYLEGDNGFTVISSRDLIIDIDELILWFALFHCWNLSR